MYGDTFSPTKVVIKVGSGVLSNERGQLQRKVLEGLVREISGLLDRGIEVTLVTSGAVSAGIGEMKERELPRSIPEKQALAAVGQSKLINLYSDEF